MLPRKIIIFNPRSANAKHRIPNSILQVAASIEGQFEYVLVDGNLERNPLDKILSYLSTGQFGFFCATVMPGPQLKQAIPFTKAVKQQFAHITTIWGGYFASNQPEVCMDSGMVDYIVNGPGDYAFPALLQAITQNNLEVLPTIESLIYKDDQGQMVKTRKAKLFDQDELNPLPYKKLNEFYPVTGTDANGCSSDAIANVVVHQAPVVDFNILNLSLTTTYSTTGFENLTTGANSYHWDFGDYTSSNAFEPEHTFPDNQGQEYAITLTAYSAEGCPAAKTKYIHVFQDYTIYVPNAFTPDGSGVNEIFKPVMEGFDPNDYTLYIFNRWGDLIFESHDMEVGWDGKFARQEYPVQDGVYTWKIEAGLKDSPDSKVFVGHVSILK